MPQPGVLLRAGDTRLHDRSSDEKGDELASLHGVNSPDELRYQQIDDPRHVATSSDTDFTLTIDEALERYARAGSAAHRQVPALSQGRMHDYV